MPRETGASGKDRARRRSSPIGSCFNLSFLHYLPYFIKTLWDAFVYREDKSYEKVTTEDTK
jgi:hypothetical protein